MWSVSENGFRLVGAQLQGVNLLTQYIYFCEPLPASFAMVAPKHQWRTYFPFDRPYHCEDLPIGSLSLDQANPTEEGFLHKVHLLLDRL